MALVLPGAGKPGTALQRVRNDDDTAVEQRNHAQQDTAALHEDSWEYAVVEGQDAQLGQGRGGAVNEAKGVEALLCG